MPMIGSGARADVLGALTTLNRSIPMADEFADAVQALENLRSGRAQTLGDGWSQARAASSAASQDFATRHPVVADLTRGAGLAAQAVPFLATGGAAAAPAVAARGGMIGAGRRVAEGAILGGLGAQVGGLTSQGDATRRVQAGNDATPAGMLIGAAIPGAVGMIGAGAGAAQRALAPQPVARLSGEELAPLDASREQLRAAARQFYNDELRGSTVPMGGADGPPVGFNQTGRDKSLAFSANPNKLRAFPALPQAIGSGQVTSTPPHKPVAPDVKAFHVIEAPVESAVRRMRCASWSARRRMVTSTTTTRCHRSRPSHRRPARLIASFARSPALRVQTRGRSEGRGPASRR